MLKKIEWLVRLLGMGKGERDKDEGKRWGFNKKSGVRSVCALF